MKKIAVLLMLFAILLLPAGAQTKKRIAFKKKFAEVSATVRGAETLDYVFRVPRNADLEIWIDHTNSASAATPKFILFKPNGKLFYDENSVNYGGLTDMMDILPQAGDYTLRVFLPEESRGEDKPVKFTVRLLLK